MATYNESLGGYIADVPRVVFRRCDKRAIYLDELFLLDGSLDRDI